MKYQLYTNASNWIPVIPRSGKLQGGGAGL